MQIMRMDVTYLGESGFLLSMEEEALLFDPGEGEEETHILPEAGALSAFKRLTVLVTRPGLGHLSPALRERCPEGTVFVLSHDLPEEEEGIRLSPGESWDNNGLSVTACPSTDAGVAFWCGWNGVRLFHAGGLNLWHWREISTIPQIETAERAFNDCLSEIPREPGIDLAFFPLDPRQGRMYDAGASAFVMTFKPRLLIPMQFQGREDAAEDFAVRGSTSSTRVAVLRRAGETLSIALSDPEGEEPEGAPPEGEPEAPEAAALPPEEPLPEGDAAEDFGTIPKTESI